MVFHLDADGPDTRTAYLERFEPGYRKVQQHEGELNKDIVPVIPVRMTEAWMLVDFEAFRQTIGTEKEAHDLGFRIHPHEVESIKSPKAVFESAVRNAKPGRRRTFSPEEIYVQLAARIRLERLARVPAYQEFSENLTATLKSLRYLED